VDKPLEAPREPPPEDSHNEERIQYENEATTAANIPILRMPQEILIQVASILRQSDLDAILVHEQDWRRCFDLESRNPSILRSWFEVRGSLRDDAAENLRDFRRVSKAFALAGARAAIIVSAPAPVSPKVWSHEPSWEVDYCPWAQLVLDSSRNRILHFVAVARNDVLSKAVRSVKVLIRAKDNIELPKRFEDAFSCRDLGDAFRQFPNIDSLTVRSCLHDNKKDVQDAYIGQNSPNSHSIMFYTVLKEVLGANCNIKSLRITDIDDRFLQLDEDGSIDSYLADLAANLTSLELRFWQYDAPYHKEAWPSNNARKAWRLLIGRSVNLERLALWNLPNNTRWDSAPFSTWSYHTDDVQLLMSLKTRQLRSLELVHAGIAGVLLADVICRHANTLEELRLTSLRLEPRREAWLPFLLRLKSQLRLKRCDIDGYKPKDWDKIHDWWEVRDIVDRYSVPDALRIRNVDNIGSYLL